MLSHNFNTIFVYKPSRYKALKTQTHSTELIFIVLAFFLLLLNKVFLVEQQNNIIVENITVEAVLNHDT